MSKDRGPRSSPEKTPLVPWTTSRALLLEQSCNRTERKSVERDRLLVDRMNFQKSAGPSQKSTVTKEKVQKDTDSKMASVREQ